ncbi:hypothetical protein RhiirC2_851710 [Rhizophagus irregularis]|uniref:Uncharacterized protein n=1 Tax=Rhizophagus irregularis TaxID=588596 RepID=A0A2N1N2J4_9GLOM|nr:hypothetical protein RhiirC2_851710 [Rhizophagus irregularis]
MDQLKNQLSNLKISHENTDNRRELVSSLEDALLHKIENTENQILSTETLNSNEEISLHQEFLLKLGWTLKENQKFGKKGGGKRISKHIVVLLEGYFLAENLNKSDRYTRYAAQHKQNMAQQAGQSMINRTNRNE